MTEKRNTETLAVIMACHNRREHTLSCLKALSKQTAKAKISIKVYLLDDGSSDGTSDAIKNKFPDVHIIKGDGTLFWNRGMHKAFAAAIQKVFDFYLWLNDDSTLYENALEILLDTHSHLKSLGHSSSIIGSAMQDPVTGNLTYGGIKRHRSKWGRVKLERVHPNNEVTQVDASNGNCVLIPASVVTKVGNLDPIYLHRSGDHDYCFRALQQGCSVWLAPGYLGTCTANPIEGTWEDSNLGMMERFRKLNSPHGYRFLDYAIDLKRHRGPWWPIHLIWPYIKILLQTVKK